MTSSITRRLDELSQAQRSSFFWKCIGIALCLQIVLFAAIFLTNIAIQFSVTFVGLFFVENAAQLDSPIRILQWLSLVPWTLAAFWWYTRWLFQSRFGSASAVFLEQAVTQQPNNALQPTCEDARG